MTSIPQSCRNHIGFIRYLLLIYRGIDANDEDVWLAIKLMVADDHDAENIIPFIIETNEGFDDLANKFVRVESTDNSNDERLKEMQNELNKQFAQLQATVFDIYSKLVCTFIFSAVAAVAGVIAWSIL